MADVTLGVSKVGLMEPPGTAHLPGPASPDVRSRTSTSLAETRSLAGFSLRVPAFTRGNEFYQAGILQAPRQAVVMSFVGEGRSRGFEFFQAPVSSFPTAPDGSPGYYVVGDELSETRLGNRTAAVSTKPPLPGRPAGVINLVWEQDGLICHMSAIGMTQEELSQIAASI